MYDFLHYSTGFQKSNYKMLLLQKLSEYAIFSPGDDYEEQNKRHSRPFLRNADLGRSLCCPERGHGLYRSFYLSGGALRTGSAFFADRNRNCRRKIRLWKTTMEKSAALAHRCFVRRGALCCRRASASGACLYHRRKSRFYYGDVYRARSGSGSFLP